MDTIKNRPQLAPLPPPTINGRIRWTREHCDFLEKSGILTARYELIDGEIILKMPQFRVHAWIVMQVIGYVTAIFGLDLVQTQATMEVRAEDRITNRPEPDVVVLRDKIWVVPTGNDVLLAVEVSGSTEDTDLEFKRDLYARAGVLEYWVVDVKNRKLIVFRKGASGTWEERREYAENESVAPLSAPENLFKLTDFLPPVGIG